MKVGLVIGTQMQKTIKVRVEKIKMHPVVNKPIRYHQNYLAHDRKELAVVGDLVRIYPCEKRGKLKNYRLQAIIKPAARYSSDNVLYTQPPAVSPLPHPKAHLAHAPK